MGITLKAGTAGAIMGLVMLACGLASGMGSVRADEPAPPGAKPAVAAEREAEHAVEPAPGPFDERLLKIAREYAAMPRASDVAAWSPEMCSAPRPAGLRMARAEPAAEPGADAGAWPAGTPGPGHARKLYLLCVRDLASYLDMTMCDQPRAARVMKFPLDLYAWSQSVHAQRRAADQPDQPMPSSYVRFPPAGAATPPELFVNPVGQTLVKETFQPVEDRAFDWSVRPADPVRYYDVSIADDGKVYRRGDRGPLFIMTKLDPETPDTDRGWVYGVVSPDAKNVLAAGRIASCMSCHEQTRKDRLFGLGGGRQPPPKAATPRGAP